MMKQLSSEITQLISQSDDNSLFYDVYISPDASRVNMLAILSDMSK